MIMIIFNELILSSYNAFAKLKYAIFGFKYNKPNRPI